MTQIQHIALAVDDPAATAEYSKKVFGLVKLNRVPADTGEKGVWLTDGYGGSDVASGSAYLSILAERVLGYPVADGGGGTGGTQSAGSSDLLTARPLVS